MDSVPRIILAFLSLSSVSLAFERTGPSIVREPVDTLYDDGSGIKTVSLYCEVAGQQPLTTVWSKDGQPLAANNRYIQTSDRLTINDPDRGVDEGSYQCEVTNAQGTVLSQEAELRFAYVDRYPPPRPGNDLDVTLETNAGGCITCNPPTHYPGIEVIWNKDRSNVVQSERVRIAIDGRLCFANVESSDAGTYFCMVKSSLEADAAALFQGSPSFEVRITEGSSSSNSPPRAAITVTDVTVKAGKTAVLECFFNGSPPPVLEWRRKAPADEPLPRTAVQTNNNQELEIRDARPEDSGEYECLASNDHGQDRSSGTLSVVDSPSWVSEPMDAGVDIHSDLTWRCEAASPYDITYIWYRNGVQIEESDDRISFSDNFRTAAFTGLQVADSAMYQCKASNEYGHIISTAQLKVNAIPPSFPIPVLMNQPAARGGTVLILCAPEGAPKPTIAWYKGSSSIATGGRYNVTDGNLHITAVEDGDAGEYRCEATNSFSTESSTGSLIIKDGTVITTPPMAKTIVIGDDGILECEASGDQDFELIYIWMFEGHQINIDDDPHYRQEGGNLHLLDATQDMHGEYTCRAETSIDADMVTAMVTVSGPPDPPTAVDVVLEELLAELTWIKGMEHNSATTGFVIETMTNHEPEWAEKRTVGDVSSATVSDLSPWSTYQFRLRATSDLGVGEPSAPSQEVTTPAAGPYVSPTGVSGGGGNQGDLRITWEPLEAKDQNGPGVYYIVHWRQQGSSNPFEMHEVRNGETVHVVSGVPVYTLYEVKVGAGNEEGTGPISEVEEVYSYQEAPRDAPAMVEGEAASGTELRVQWDAIDDSNFQGVLTGYRIYYWPEGSTQEDAEIVLSEGEGTVALLEDLTPATKYYIVIEAMSGGGQGPASQEVTVMTKKMAPLKAPAIRNAQLKNGDSVTVEWSPITTGDMEEPLNGYKIVFWKHGTLIDTAETRKVSKDATSYTIKGLEHETRYYIKVQGTSNGGDGVLSEQHVIETNKPSAGSSSDPDNEAAVTTSLVSLIGSLVLISLLMSSE